MFWLHWREVFELMTAARAGSDDHGAGRLRVDLVHERPRDFQGEIVFPLERAKGAGHAATASIEQGRGSSGQSRRQPSHEARFYEGLRMAVRVDRDVAGNFVELKSVRLLLQQLVDELFEEMAAFRDRPRAG